MNLSSFVDVNQPAQCSRIVQIIEEQVDLPARQIIIEAMVLSLVYSTSRTRVQWELNQPGAGNFFSEDCNRWLHTFIGNIAYPAVDTAAQPT